MNPQKLERLRDDADEIGRRVGIMMSANGIPIDTCLFAAELALEAGRAVGYRVRAVPFKVRAFHDDGREGRHLGYVAEVAEDRYNGHVVAMLEGRVGIDITAGQIHPEIGPITFVAHRQVRLGDIFRVQLPNGWQIRYESFDDRGDWRAGVTGQMTRDLRVVARKLVEGGLR